VPSLRLRGHEGAHLDRSASRFVKSAVKPVRLPDPRTQIHVHRAVSSTASSPPTILAPRVEATLGPRYGK